MSAESLYKTNLRGEVITIEDRYMAIKEVVAKTTLDRSTLYAYEQNCAFPQMHRLSKTRVVFLASDVEEFLRLGYENFVKVYGETLRARKGMEAA
ncbi:helix-turn-helix transcriptional regulator [Pseudoalteromonas obscura]|uniref:AlpA family phage regulatory protein n=1 Tax=Pseudoalteromonas obscura TaxID=3048491 RepID=A0ABT7ES91_9GAMM|nr:AlpA family phage regulatory protein [Pseudoalteromonas sp. P94(2023)]MDK2597924.1 AlpA family phage regulatory protein [Pseudoalteromonas sp. P94(2023)]